jgi:hypothetical protein
MSAFNLYSMGSGEIYSITQKMMSMMGEVQNHALSSCSALLPYKKETRHAL